MLKKKEIDKVTNNKHIFCFNECCVTECYKHKTKCPYDNEYIFAFFKDTPYCPYYEIV